MFFWSDRVRLRVLAAAVALVSTAVVVTEVGAATGASVAPSVASRSVSLQSVPASISLDENFTGATLNDPLDWIAVKGGTEWPCLTAASASISAAVGYVEACVNQGGSVATAGQGVLRLTRATGGQAASLLYAATLSASEGMDISFSIKMAGGSGADGVSFFLKDGTNTTNSAGASGGALGYAGSPGVPGALLGVGFDKYGNFSLDNNATGTCAIAGPGQQANRLVLRGPDTSAAQDGTQGYCYLAGSAVTYSTSTAQRVRIVVDTFTPGQPTTVSAYIASNATPTLLPTTPTLITTVTISASSFTFGFSASTGGAHNNHDISGLGIRPAGPKIAGVATGASTGSGTGPTGGGTLLTITGTDIDPAATVTVDGQSCGTVTVSGGGTQLTCLTPAGSPGAKEVVVTNPNGGPGYATFTYVNPAPTVTGVSPEAGAPVGGNTITITGTGFVANATVSVGGQLCTSVVVVSSTTLTCEAPAGTDGDVVDIVVTNVGPVAGTGVGLYTYRPPVILPPQLPGLVAEPVATTTVAPPATTVAPTTTVPSSTVPPEPVPADPESGALPELAPGESAVTEDGVTTPVEVVVENSTDLVLRGADFELRLAGDCTGGCTVQTDDAGRQVIQLESDGSARVAGEGFLPGTPVYVWLFSTPTFLGELMVLDDGTFSGLVPLAGVDVGQHTLQVNGTSFDGEPRTANLGVIVTEAAVPAPGDGELPSTGRDLGLLLWVLALITSGAVLLATRRRAHA